MKNSRALFRYFTLIAATGALIAGSGCTKKVKQNNGGVPNAFSADENQTGDSDSGTAMGLQTVHFEYDSALLGSEGKKVLDQNAEIMKDHPNLKVQIEGNCDQRGGIQYNIALGQKRADSAKKYLEDKGISGSRISTISYGKEKPLDPANTKAAYAKNRRDDFAITSK